MNPVEIQSQLRTFKKRVGKQAWVHIHIPDNGAPLHVDVYPNGVCRELAFSLRSETWEMLFAALHEKWDAYAETHGARTVRRMALAIIRLTAELGEAPTDAALRADGFSGDDITAFLTRACADADEIAGNGPFTVRVLKGANGAPVEAA